MPQVVGFEEVLDSSKFRIYKTFDIPMFESRNLCLQFPLDDLGEQWGYGMSIELLQSLYSDFRVTASAIVTIEDYNLDPIYPSPMNIVYANAVQPRTLAHANVDFTFLDLPGRAKPYEILVGNKEVGTDNDVGTTLILVGGLNLVFSMENLGPMAGECTLAVQVQERKLPLSTFQVPIE